MSERLPVVSGKEFIRVLERCGWRICRQTGSHIILTNSNGTETLPVPHHKTLDKGLLHSLIKKAGLTTKEFREML